MRILLLLILLTASAFSQQTINVTFGWDAPTDSPTSFKLYEKTGPATAPVWTPVGTLIPGQQVRYTHTVTGYNPANSRTFALTAVNAIGIESVLSNEVVVSSPASPKGFKVEVVVKVQVN